MPEPNPSPIPTATAALRSSPTAAPIPLSLQIAQAQLAREQYAQALYEEALNQTAQDRAEAKLMRRPVPMVKAYRVLGLSLGTLPPAAIFLKLFGYGLFGPAAWWKEPRLSIVLLVMNLICAVVGYFIAGTLSRPDDRTPRDGDSGIELFFRLPLTGLAWGAVTGGAGGAICILYGPFALFGPLCAIPVGIVGFTAFGILHGRFQRGGMIERRVLRLLSSGISLIISILILLMI
jgi:hypothetical protein